MTDKKSEEGMFDLAGLKELGGVKAGDLLAVELRNKCGDCSAYKTPFCSFANQNAIISKGDGSCSDFYPDRHLYKGFKKKKARRVIRKVGKR